MKITPNLMVFIAREVTKHSANFGIQKPQVLLTTQEVKALPKTIDPTEDITACRKLGMAYLDHNIIFLNIAQHDGRPELRDTIVHEITHLKFPCLKHSPTFYNIVKRGIKGRPPTTLYSFEPAEPDRLPAGQATPPEPERPKPTPRSTALRPIV